LYSNFVPAANFKLPYHNGVPSVYISAFNLTAFVASQVPNSAIDPTTYTFCPNEVVCRTLKVSETEVAVVQVNVGQAVLVAALYVPVADVEEQEAGTLFADAAPQEAGTTLFLAFCIVRKEA
jgi:hypothetical protein